MKMQNIGSLAIALLLLSACVSHGDTIFQSSTVGTHIGVTINSNRIIGVHFHLDSTVVAHSIGGELVGIDDSGHLSTTYNGGMLFGAIVRLASPTDVPDSNFPLDTSDVLVHTLIPVGSPNQDTSASVGSVTLDAGDYALIFGSGQFGGNGRAFAEGGTENGTPDYFYSDLGGGYNDGGGITNIRLFVSGDAAATPLPSPALSGMILFGTFGGAVIVKRRRAVLKF